MFVVIMTSLIRRAHRSAKLTTGEKGNAEQVRRFALIAIGLSVVFGLGWGLGLAASSSDIEELTFVFQVLFSVFVGSQGVIIFVLHGLRSKDARLVWKSWFSFLPCVGTGKIIDLSHSTSKDVTTRSRPTESSSTYRLSTLRRESQTSMKTPVKEPMRDMSEGAITEVDESTLEKNPELGPEVTPIEGDVIENAAVVVNVSDLEEASVKKDVEGGLHVEPQNAVKGEEIVIVIENVDAQEPQTGKAEGETEQSADAGPGDTIARNDDSGCPPAMTDSDTPTWDLLPEEESAL